MDLEKLFAKNPTREWIERELSYEAVRRAPLRLRRRVILGSSLEVQEKRELLKKYHLKYSY